MDRCESIGLHTLSFWATWNCQSIMRNVIEVVYIPGGQSWVIRRLVDSVQDLDFTMSRTLRAVN